jgi:teichuronic acid exporter
VAGVAWSLLTVGLSSVLALSVFLITSRVLSPADFGAVALAAAVRRDGVDAGARGLRGGADPARGPAAAPSRQRVLADLGMAGVLYGPVLFCRAASRLDGARRPGGDPARPRPAHPLRRARDGAGALVARRMQFRYTALRSLLANAVAAGLCVWLVLEGFALWALVLSQIANGFVAMVVSVWPHAGGRGGTSPPTALRDLGFFGLYAMGGRILNQARLDHLLLGVVWAPATLGLYYFAHRLFTMLGDLTSGVFGPVTGVLMASLQAEPDKRREAFRLASFASAALAFPVFGGLIVLAPVAVPVVFGPQWTDAVYALQCFCVMGMLAGRGDRAGGADPQSRAAGLVVLVPGGVQTRRAGGDRGDGAPGARRDHDGSRPRDAVLWPFRCGRPAGCCR